ncbi:MAG: hypothetical protein K2P45_07335 [Eubacterium sp.]|nr:hypothetical protein [Eubacterium sp.]
MPKTLKKKQHLLFVLMLMAALCTGCTNHTQISLNENGSGSFEQNASIEKALWEELMDGSDSDEWILIYFQTLYPQAKITFSDEDLDETVSKVFHFSMDLKDISDLKLLLSNSEMFSVCYNANYFSRSRLYMPMEEDEDDPAYGFSDELEQMLGSKPEAMQKLVSEIINMDCDMTISFPYEIADTNGSVQKDGKTVLWNLEQMQTERLYALFQTSNSVAAPKFEGAANGKAYNTGVSLTITSENLLDKVKVNDESTQSDSLFLSTEGVYQVTASDINGNTSSLKFRIDTTKPVISGVKNGKSYKSARTIRFSDNGSGIKYASLNGQTIKSGKKVSKNGTYTLEVCDKAGNLKRITFKMKA